MNFSSDNVTGASPQVLEALVAANAGGAAPYGADPWTREAERQICALFEREVAVSLVATGTAANALALAAVAPPGSAVFCHEEAHVAMDECGAPEFFVGGGKLVGLAGAAGKVTAAALGAALARFPRGVPRQTPAAALSIAQATEAGTLYAPAEIRALAEVAHAAGLAVHMDGARFSNAVAAQGVSPAEATWKAGVDVLSFGATKNGALACEAVVFFDPARGRDFAIARKRGGHTLSKGRLLGAQMAAFLADGHWLDLARRANRAAARLAAGLAALPGVRLAWPVEANEVFPILPVAMDAALRAAGAHYHPWESRAVAGAGPDEGERLVRLVCAFDTGEERVDEFLRAAHASAVQAR